MQKAASFGAAFVLWLSSFSSPLLFKLKPHIRDVGGDIRARSVRLTEKRVLQFCGVDQRGHPARDRTYPRACRAATVVYRRDGSFAPYNVTALSPACRNAYGNRKNSDKKRTDSSSVSPSFCHFNPPFLLSAISFPSFSRRAFWQKFSSRRAF